VLLHQRGIWLLIEAEFLAVVLILVYVGAVMVLFLFVVMMLDINVEEVRARVTRYALFGGIVAGVVVFEIVSVVWTRSLGLDVTTGAQAQPANYSNTAELGKLLYTQYVYAFELAAVLLLIAIVAAISLTMRKRAGLKQQNVARQVAVRAEDRVRIIKMPAEGAGSSRLPRRSTRRRVHDPAQLAADRLERAVRHLRGGMFINRKNLILLLMCVELLLLAVNFNFVSFSRYLGDINGQIFVFFVLTVAAAESAIGLRHPRGAVPRTAQHQRRRPEHPEGLSA
jgi:NADH-quinone oxidoreductase subunit J